MRHIGNAANLLGIRPWEWDLMNVEDTDRALDWLERYEEDMKKAG